MRGATQVGRAIARRCCEVSSQEGPEVRRRRSPRPPYSDDAVTCNMCVIGDVPLVSAALAEASRDGFLVPLHDDRVDDGDRGLAESPIELLELAYALE
jgi:hypothetical protein